MPNVSRQFDLHNFYVNDGQFQKKKRMLFCCVHLHDGMRWERPGMYSLGGNFFTSCFIPCQLLWPGEFQISF